MITEESFVDFKCPYCGEAVSFPGTDAGSARECPGCMEPLVVPAESAAFGGKLPLPVSASRLVLRRLKSSDWQDLLAFLSDEALFRHVEGWPLEEEQILQWLEIDNHVKLTSAGQVFCLGIESLADNKLVGYVGMSFSNSHPLQATIGSFFLSRSHQHQGLAREALTALLGFCFQGINCHRVSAWCDSRNTAACRLFEHSRMRREAEFVKDRRVKEEWVSTVWYGVLAEEYARTKAPSTI